MCLIGILQAGEIRASQLCAAASRWLSGFLFIVEYGEMYHSWQSSEATRSWVCLLGFRWIFTLHQLWRKCCAFKCNPFASVISQTAQGKHGGTGGRGWKSVSDAKTRVFLFSSDFWSSWNSVYEWSLYHIGVQKCTNWVLPLLTMQTIHKAS